MEAHVAAIGTCFRTAGFLLFVTAGLWGLASFGLAFHPRPESQRALVFLVAAIATVFVAMALDHLGWELGRGSAGARRRARATATLILCISLALAIASGIWPEAQIDPDNWLFAIVALHLALGSALVVWILGGPRAKRVCSQAYWRLPERKATPGVTMVSNLFFWLLPAALAVGAVLLTALLLWGH